MKVPAGIQNSPFETSGLFIKSPNLSALTLFAAKDSISLAVKGTTVFLPPLPSFPAWHSGSSTKHCLGGPYTSSPHGCSPWAQGPSVPQRVPCREASAQMSFHESRWRGDQFFRASERMEGMFPKLNASSLPGAFYTWTDPMMPSPILNICHLCISIENSATNTHRVTVFPFPDFHSFAVSSSFYNSSTVVLQVIWYYLYVNGVQHYHCARH